MVSLERCPPPIVPPPSPSVLRNYATYYDAHQQSEVATTVYCPPEQSELQQHNVFTSSKRAIYALIAEEIGKNWRNLGRELGVSEGRLDEIEDEHRGNTANKVHAMFQHFERRTLGPVHQYETLQLGLQQVRRRDLVQRMEQMFLSSL